MIDVLFLLFDLIAMPFVFSAMLSLGLGAHPAQARRPLRRTGFLLAAVEVGFAVIPGAALMITRLLPVDVSLAEGLL